jgi:alginate O-acetyltransferase complex protein AlgI
MYFNLCLCFFLSGLWHGAAWPFVFWGVFHGVMLICDRLFWAKMQRRLPQFLNLSITFFLVMISWVIFRAGTYERMELMLHAMAIPWAPSRPNTLWFSGDIAFCITVGYALIFVPALPRWQKFVEAYGRLSWRPVLELGGSVALLLMVLTKVSMESFNAFLYFRF